MIPSLGVLDSVDQRPVRRAAPSLILLGSALCTLALAALPVTYLIRRAVEIDLETLSVVLFRAKMLEILLTTLTLTLSVAAFATILGVSIAWGLNNVALPALGLIRALVILPVAIPSYVFTYTWLSLEFLPTGFFAAVAVLTLTTAPYVTLAALAAFRRIDASQLDVAQTLGLNQWQTFMRVTFPQIRNAVGAGSLIVALYVLSDFGAVSLLGVDTFTRAIQNTYQGSFDRSSAAILALFLVAISTIVITLEIRTRTVSQTVTSSVRITKRLPYNNAFRAKVITIASISIYILLALLLPLLVLIYRFVSRITPLDYSSLLNAALSTISVSLIGALIAVLLAIPVALLASRGSRLAGKAINSASR